MRPPIKEQRVSVGDDMGARRRVIGQAEEENEVVNLQDQMLAIRFMMILSPV